MSDLPERLWIKKTEKHGLQAATAPGRAPFFGAEYFRADDLLSAGWLPPSHAREQAERIATLGVKLARFAIIETYDYPGDVPEFCGWWCNLCKEHVELDGSGHHADCMIAGQMPAPTPPASQEGQADAD